MLKKCLKYTAALLVCCLLTIFCFKELLSVKEATALVGTLPAPNSLLSKSTIVDYPMLTGLKINENNPFALEFIVEGADSEQFSKQYQDMLINIFLSAVTIPKEKFWVNLDPNEKDRIIEEDLLRTDSGRLFLEQDYVLKLFSSSLSSPKTKTGQSYWEQLLAQDKLNLDKHESLNKFWVVPKQAKLSLFNNAVLINNAELSVEQRAEVQSENVKHANQLLLKDIEKEVNNAENFALLRAFYRSFVLGLWYKDQLKGSFMDNYINSSKVKGIDNQDPALKEKLYSQYLKSLKNGVYKSNEQIGKNAVRTYCAGGFGFGGTEYEVIDVSKNAFVDQLGSMSSPLGLSIDLEPLQDKPSVEQTIARRASPRIVFKETRILLEDIIASKLLETRESDLKKLITHLDAARTKIMADIFKYAHEDALVRLSYMRWALESNSLTDKDKSSYLNEHIDNFFKEIFSIEIDDIESLDDRALSSFEDIEKKITPENNGTFESSNIKSTWDIKNSVKTLAAAVTSIFAAALEIFSQSGLHMPESVSQNPLSTLLSFPGRTGYLKGFNYGLSDDFKYLVTAEFDMFDHRSDEFTKSDNPDITMYSRQQIYTDENFKLIDKYLWDYWRKLKKQKISNASDFRADNRRSINISLDNATEQGDYYVLPSVAVDDKYLAIPLGLVNDEAVGISYGVSQGRIYLNKQEIDSAGLRVVEFDYMMLSPQMLRGDAAHALEDFKESFPQLFDKGVQESTTDIDYDLGVIEDKIVQWSKSGLPDHLLAQQIETFLKDYLFYGQGISDWFSLLRASGDFNYQKTLNSHIGVCHDANKLFFMILQKLDIKVKYVTGYPMKEGQIIDVGHGWVKYWSKERKQWLRADATPKRLNKASGILEDKVDADRLTDYLDPRFVNPHFFEMVEGRFETISKEQKINPKTRIVRLESVRVPGDASFLVMPVSSKAGRLSYDDQGQLYLKINPGQFYNKVEVEYIRIPADQLDKGIAAKSLCRINGDYFSKVKEIEPLESRLDLSLLDETFKDMLDDLSDINESNSELIKRIPKFLSANFYKREFTFFKKIVSRDVAISNWTYKQLFLLVANELGIAIRNYEINHINKDTNATLEYFDDQSGMWLKLSDGYFNLAHFDDELDHRTLNYRLRRLEEQDPKLNAIVEESEDIRDRIWSYYSDARDKPLPYYVQSKDYNVEIAYQQYLGFMAKRLELLRKLDKELIESDTYKAVESLSKVFEKLSPQQHEDLLTTLEIVDRYEFMKQELKISNGRNLSVSNRLVFDNEKLAKATIRRFSRFNVGFRYRAKLNFEKDSIDIDLDWEKENDRQLFYFDSGKGYDEDQIISAWEDYQRAEDEHGRNLVLMRINMQLDIDIRLEGEDEELDGKEQKAIDLLLKKRKSLSVLEKNFNGLALKVEKTKAEERWQKALKKLEQDRVAVSSALVQEARRSSPRVIVNELKTILESLLKTEIFDDELNNKYKNLLRTIQESRVGILARIFENQHEDALVKLSYINWAMNADSLPRDEQRQYITKHLDEIVDRVMSLQVKETEKMKNQSWELQEKQVEETEIEYEEIEVQSKFQPKEIKTKIIESFNFLRAIKKIAGETINNFWKTAKEHLFLKTHNRIVNLMPLFTLGLVAGFFTLILTGMLDKAILLIGPIVVLTRFIDKVNKATPQHKAKQTSSLKPKVHKQSAYATLLNDNKPEKYEGGIELRGDFRTQYISDAEYDSYDYKKNEFYQSGGEVKLDSTDMHVGLLHEQAELRMALDRLELAAGINTGADALSSGYLQVVRVNLNKVAQANSEFVIPMPIFSDNYISIFKGFQAIPIHYRIANGNIYIEKQMLLRLLFGTGESNPVLVLEFMLLPEKALRGNLKTVFENLKQNSPELFEQKAKAIEHDTNYDLGPIDKRMQTLVDSELPDHLIAQEITKFIRDYLYYAQKENLYKLMKADGRYEYQKTLNSRLGVCHDANKLLFMALTKYGIAAKYVGGNVVNANKIDPEPHGFIKYWSREKERWLLADATPIKYYIDNVKLAKEVKVSSLNEYVDPRFVHPRLYSIAEQLTDSLMTFRNPVFSERRVVTLDRRVFSGLGSGKLAIPISSDQGKLYYDSQGKLYLAINEDQYYDYVEINYLAVDIETYNKHSVFKSLKSYNDKFFTMTNHTDLSRYLITDEEIDERIKAKIDEIGTLVKSNAELVKIIKQFIEANFVIGKSRSDRKTYSEFNEIGREAAKILFYNLLYELGVPVRNIEGNGFEFYDEHAGLWVHALTTVDLKSSVIGLLYRRYNYDFERQLDHNNELRSIHKQITKLERKLKPIFSVQEDSFIKYMQTYMDNGELKLGLQRWLNALEEIDGRVEQLTTGDLEYIDKFVSELTELECERLLEELIGMDLKEYKHYEVKNSLGRGMQMTYVVDRSKIKNLLLWRLMHKHQISFVLKGQVDDLKVEYQGQDGLQKRLEELKKHALELKIYINAYIRSVEEKFKEGAIDEILTYFNLKLEKFLQNSFIAKVLERDLMEKTSYRETDYYGQLVYVAATEEGLDAEKKMKALEESRVTKSTSSSVGGLDFKGAVYEINNSDNPYSIKKAIKISKDFQGFSFRLNYSLKLNSSKAIESFLK